MMFIQLRGKNTRFKYVIIDDEDFDKIKKHKWKIDRNKSGNEYAASSDKIDGRHKYISMHRIIMDAPKNMDVDHINHDGLDNRKENLRICTRQENLRNRKLSNNRLYTIYKGVRLTSYKKWVAQISINEKNTYIGTFNTDEEAAKAYDVAAIKHFGVFACLNFPDFDYSNYIPNPYTKKGSKYRGVNWCSDRKKWRVSRQINNKRVRIGDYTTEKDAAKAYDEYLKKNGITKGYNFTQD